MNLMIGFGRTEEDFEQAEITAFKEFAEDRLHGEPYVTPEALKEITDWAENRGKEFREKSDAYREADKFPSRYSYFYPHVMSSASYVAVILKFSHINRRHAMSPDGWAMLSSERAAWVKVT